MKDLGLRYNERSWAIDLISYINSQISQDDAIQHAGGEWTLSSETQSLFPDVLLFGDQSKGNVLQGWELKLPDTPIQDNVFIDKAKNKAIILGLDSFVAWNAQSAHLYIKNTERDIFELHNEPLYHNTDLRTRQDVENRPDLWQEAARIILKKLNSFFISGVIVGTSPDAIFKNESFIVQLLSCQSEVKAFIDQKIITDGQFDAKVKLWWKYVKNQYPGYSSPSVALAFFVLLRWFNRFVFSNILKAYNIPLKDIEKIKEETSVEDALSFFHNASLTRDFWHVLGPADFDAMIPERVWKILLSFNDFLQQFNFGQIDRPVLQSILKSVLLSSIKKAAGIYATPPELAHLLVLLSLDDKSSTAIDPFCGTGTIVKAILTIKSDFNIAGYQAAQSTWACDKFAFPVQISTLMISSPENMKEPLRVFTHDALTLSPGEKISFINPSNGEKQNIEIPRFSAIISNLPFIQFEDIEELNRLVNQKIADFYNSHSVERECRLDGRSDFYAYVPFILYDLLEDGGRLGIIISNSWLSTGWGIKFRELLQDFYTIECIVTSAKGRWFSNTDVVTNLLICQKKTQDTPKQIKFVATQKQLSESNVGDVATDILANSPDSDNAYINIIPESQLSVIDSLNIGWTSCFADMSWLLEHLEKLELLSNHMLIPRGARRGWNDLFYPSQEYWPSIEDIFLKPVLKTIRGKYNLTVSADHKAFSCSHSMEELNADGYTGALAWIKRYENGVNTKGKPLVKVLARSNLKWYEMDTSTKTDFVLSVNPDDRLFIAKTNEPIFVDQRLVRIVREDNNTNMKLLHALMNSCISMFLIEALGFGRGLGVLDINATKIRRGFRIPRLDLIEQQAVCEIIDAFSPLCDREVLPVTEEIQQADRQNFDKVILHSIGIPEDICNDIYSALLTLYNIRKSVDQ
ncbi:MAG: N-6 DNA methylase [Phycisphaerae bacterium]|jgi:hypothetical protein